MARPRPARPLAKAATLAVLALGYLAVLAADLPGHLTYDSVIQLDDGRNGRYHLWHPPVMAWLLGLGDAIHPGAAVFVIANAAMAFGAFAALVLARRRVSWAAAVLALLFVASPLVLLYQGIVWKDVLFANATVAGFTALAVSARLRRSLFVAALAAGFGFLIMAALTRQNGAVVLPAGAVALFLIIVLREGRKARGRAFGVALFVLVVSGALAWAASNALYARRVDEVGPANEVRAIQVFDVIGAATHDPFVSFTPFGPEVAPALRAAMRAYTPQRIDTLADQPGIEAANENAPAVRAAWLDTVVHHPRAYLAHRLDVFRWMAAPPDVRRCAAAPVGVDGPKDEMADLGLAERLTPKDKALQRYAGLFFATPVYSHLPYALVAVVLALVFFRSREPAEAVLGVMLAASLVFAASFLLIGLACDYRYLYAIDLAAMAAALYWAAGLGGRRKR